MRCLESLDGVTSRILRYAHACLPVDMHVCTCVYYYIQYMYICMYACNMTLLVTCICLQYTPHTHTYIYIHTYIHIHIDTRMHVLTCMYICMYTCVYTYTCIHMHTHDVATHLYKSPVYTTYTHLCTHIHTHTYRHTHARAYMHVCVYIHMHACM